MPRSESAVLTMARATEERGSPLLAVRKSGVNLMFGWKLGQDSCGHCPVVA